MLSLGMLGTTLRLSRPEYKELQARVRSRVLRAGDGRRARLILMLSKGQSWSARDQGRPATKRTPRLEARILAWTRRTPTDGSTHWSSRKLARTLGVNH